MTAPFAIYYADGTVYEGGGDTDEQVIVESKVSRDWLAAPSDRVLGVVSFDPVVCRNVYKASDYFFPFTDGSPGFANTNDLEPWLNGNLPGVVKIGEYVSNETMREFNQWVKAYGRIPRECSREEIR